MPWTTLWSIAAHHAETADPDLLDWIKHRLDRAINLEPWTIVAILAVVIVLMPVSIIAVYLMQQRRQAGSSPSMPEQEES